MNPRIGRPAYHDFVLLASLDPEIGQVCDREYDCDMAACYDSYEPGTPGFQSVVANNLDYYMTQPAYTPPGSSSTYTCDYGSTYTPTPQGLMFTHPVRAAESTGIPCIARTGPAIASTGIPITGQTSGPHDSAEGRKTNCCELRSARFGGCLPDGTRSLLIEIRSGSGSRNTATMRVRRGAVGLFDVPRTRPMALDRLSFHAPVALLSRRCACFRVMSHEAQARRSIR